jgi:aminopeptidase N
MKKTWRAFLIGLLVHYAGSTLYGRAADFSNELTGSNPGAQYDIKFYHLNLQVSDSSTYIQGYTDILLESRVSSLEQVVIDFSNALQTDSVVADRQKLQYVHNKNALQANLASAAPIGTLKTIRIYYHGLGKNTGTYSGIYNKLNTSWNKRITWTLSEPFSAMNWFPCKQDLNDKADSVYVFLSTDSMLKAGSNGLLTAQVSLPGNRVRYEWKSRYPIAYYLISFAVGDYMDYSFYVKKENEKDSLLVQNYVYNDPIYFEQNRQAIDITGDLIRLYAGLFGSYPFVNEKYGHCVAPLGGGMEHQTMTTLVNFFFLLVAHELAHQWFGDYVTCSTWQDIWINEGFASYCEYISSQYLKSQAMADLWIADVQQNVRSKPDGSVYVPENMLHDEDRIFDYRLTYNKGAAIIHMIRQEVGNDSLFFEIMASFLQQYRNGIASGLDFRDHLQNITGKDFTAFFEQWYFGEGYPIHSISWNQQADTLIINSLQTVSAGTPLFNVLLEFKITFNNRDTLITLRQTNSFNTWKIFLPGAVTSINVDPRHWLLLEVAEVTQTLPAQRKSNFRIVPNPAKDKVGVFYAAASQPYFLFLANASGKILYTSTIEAAHIDLDISQYTAGMYFIIIKDQHAILQEKFIIY